MALAGTISPEARAVNEAREQLAQAIDKSFGTGYLAREQFLAALEHFINVKAVTNHRY